MPYSRLQAWATYAAILAISLLMVTPITMLVATSFEVNAFSQPTRHGLDNWAWIATHHRLLGALGNTISLTVARTALGIALGVPLAWLLARSNLPGRGWFELGFWIALFMPSLPVTLAWILLLDHSGLLNHWLIAGGILHRPFFDIYSWWGIVWVHLTGASLAASVFLLTPTFRNMDASLEEAARTSGASITMVVWRIVVPIMLPSILMVLLLSFIRALQAFEVELVLGAPARINVYSTVVYRVMTSEPPLQGLASTLSIALLMAVIPLVLLQQRFVRAAARPVISGKARVQPQDLGRLKWPIFGLVLVLITLMTIVPFAFLLTSSFMKIFGLFDLTQVWTLDNWRQTLVRADFLSALRHTLVIGATAALSGMIAFTLIAYLIVRTRVRGRGLLDFLTWVPALIPGVVLSLGLLQFFSAAPLLRAIYGSLAILVLAILIASATVGTQLLGTALRQLSHELEEAAWVSGASRGYTLRRIVLPLIAPTVAVVGLEIFATSSSAVGILSLLGTGSNQPLSILQLTQMDSGAFEEGSVTGIIIMGLTVGSALLAKAIGTRYRSATV